MNRLHWTRLLAFVTGLINQELLIRNEYLLAENRILRAHLPSRLRLMDPERHTLAEIAKRVGREVMKDIAQVAKPDTILGWYKRLVAAKFDGSAKRRYPGRPRVSTEESLSGSVATTVEETGSSLGGASRNLPDAQQCPKYLGLPQQIVPGYSQNLAFANHVYRLDPLEQPPSGRCASWSLHCSQAALDGSVVRFDPVVRIGSRAMPTRLTDQPLTLQFANRCWVAAQTIPTEDARRTVVSIRQCLLQETFGGFPIARLR